MTRIKLARELSKLTRAEAAEKLGVPYTTYANWENDEREPPIAMIVKMCGLFNCAADFLLGTGPRESKPICRIGEEMTAEKCAAELERLICARERAFRDGFIIDGEKAFLKRENDNIFPVYDFALLAVKGCIPKNTKCSCGYENNYCPQCRKPLKE